MPDLPPKIDYPAIRSEAETQAEIYKAFKAAGYDPRLEVPAYITMPTPKGIKLVECRFDVVVFKDRRALCIIECKRVHSPAWMTGQLARYKQFGIPVYLGWENNCQTLLNQVGQDIKLKSSSA